MTVKNPFLVSGYVAPAYFCDREADTEQIISALSNNRHLTLVSIRRLGKTGLIKHVFHRLKDSKYRLLYLDILSTTSLQDLVRQLGNAIIADESKHSTDYLKRIGKLLAGLKARLVFDPVTNAPAIEVAYSNHTEAEMSLSAIFQYLSGQKTKYIIAIDEFQQITAYPEKNVEAVLRSHIQHLTNVSFLYSGSNKHLLASMFSDHGRPFYQSSDFLYLKRIHPELYAEFICEKFADSKRKINYEAVLEVLAYYDTYTLYVQSYFNRLYATGEKNITTSLIEEIKEVVLNEREYIFYNYRSLLTESQFEILKAIAKEGAVAQPTSKDFMQRHGFVQSSSILRALKALVDKEMVYEEEGAYKVYDVFLSKWLERL